MAANISESTWSYALIRLYTKFAYRLFYRNITIKGLENIPQHEPVIFTANHQNALMDALAIVNAAPMPVTFLARADIFKNKRIARILNFMKIMPVFRMRDGYENLEKNDEIFKNTLNVLAQKHALCLMPEGTHGDMHMLKPLVKGVFRMVFQFANEYPDKQAPFIIPVGIELSDYQKYRSSIVIIFGKPIDPSPYIEESKLNMPLAMNNYRNRLTSEIKALMVHVNVGEHYTNLSASMRWARPIIYKHLNLSKLSDYHNYLSDKYFSTKATHLYENSTNTFESFITDCNTATYPLSPIQIHNSNSPVTAYNHWLIPRVALLIVLMPVFVIGSLLHLLPIALIYMVTRNIADKQFHSSVKFGLCALLFPVYYIALFSIALGHFNNIGVAGLYTAGIFTAGLLCIFYMQLFENAYLQFNILTLYTTWKTVQLRLETTLRKHHII